MAFTDDDWRVVVRGNLANGEVWANTWGIRDLVDADPQDVADAFHNTYAGWAGVWANTTTADQITIVKLGTNTEQIVSWTTITGEDDTNPALPNECAIRLSLTGDGGVRGGPFLAGFSTVVLNDSGNVDGTIRTNLMGAVEALRDELALVDAVLGIIRPTAEDVVTVQTARIGRVIDAIRRRRNDITEDYLSLDMTP